MNYPPFYVGQKVICIEHYPTNPFGFILKGIKLNEILTVRKCYVLEGRGCVLFNEIINPPQYGFPESDNMEPAYPSKRFAPVHENFESITLEKVLEAETKLISVN